MKPIDDEPDEEEAKAESTENSTETESEASDAAEKAEGTVENPDGTPICMDRDFFCAERGEMPLPGPFEQTFTELDIPAGTV